MDIFDIFSDRDPTLKDEYELEDLLGGDGYINIPPFLWNHLNDIYTQEQIRTMLTDCVFKFNLDPPYKIYSEGDLWKDFESLQNRVQSLDVSEAWYPPKPLDGIADEELTFQGKHYLILGSNLGMTTSNHFSQHARFLVTNRDRKGITATWNDYHTLHVAFNSLWGLKVNKVDRNNIRSCLRMRRYLPSQFKASVAKYLYESFDAKRVLDPSAGWGDRLSGFLGSKCTTEYVGIDPNSLLHPCYKKQFEFYSQRVSGKTATFIHSPAEDADLSEYKEYFDLVFTSPPYFDAERYSQEDTQSFARYPTVESWLNNFMFPTLRKSWESLRVGGVLIFNIVDVYNDRNKAVYRICKPMLDFMSSLQDCQYQGTIGYQMRARPNRNQSFNSHFAERDPQAEPMWIWSKGSLDRDPFLKKEIWEM